MPTMPATRTALAAAFAAGLRAVRGAVLPLAILSAALVPTAALAQAEEDGPAVISPRDPSEEKADAVLTRMSDFLAAQPGFAFRAASFFDVDTNGDLVKRFVLHDVKLKRPNRVYFRSVFDDGNIMEGWFDGSRFTLVHPLQKTYSVIDISGTVDDLILFLQERFIIRIPLGDVLFSNFMEQHDPFILRTRFLGERTIEGAKVDQVSAELQEADWQIWITGGVQPVPVRFLTTYLRPASRPEYMVTFLDWKFGAGPDSDYAGKLPADFKETDIDQ